MEMYGVSRGTVQKGIQILVDEGLVTREKGRGTYVSKPDIEQMSGSSLLSFAESLRMQDIDFDTKVLRMEIVPANKTCAKKLGVPENSPVLYLQRVRSTAGGPLIFMESLRPGRGMGHVLPEALAAAGVRATFLNHAENPMTVGELAATMARAREVGILTVVCADSVEEARAIAELRPDVMARLVIPFEGI